MTLIWGVVGVGGVVQVFLGGYCYLQHGLYPLYIQGEVKAIK